MALSREDFRNLEKQLNAGADLAGLYRDALMGETASPGVGENRALRILKELEKIYPDNANYIRKTVVAEAWRKQQGGY